VTTSSGARKITRRTALAGLAALPLQALAGRYAHADEWAGAAHGLSSFGDLKYRPDFSHFDYVDPAAPKGGEFSQMGPSVLTNQSFQTFSSLNMHILSGDGAQGMEHCFDTLMVRAFDEPDAVYGLVADRVLREGRAVRFRLRPEARFHDGSPLTAEDVVWTFRTLVEKGHPIYRQIVGSIKEIEAAGPHELRLTLPQGHSRDLLMVFATLPILSKAFYATRDFTAVTLEAPLGSGPVKVGRVATGRSIEYLRVADYWAKDLPVRRGHYNFDRYRFEFHPDRASGFLAFKAREYTFREEFTSRAWATEYGFDAVADGRIKRDEIEDGTISGGQGWYFNLRRNKFADIRIREALQLAFDFEWSNANLFFGSYKRSNSLFEGAPFMARGMPAPAELALLEPFRDRMSPAAFGEPVAMPASDGSGSDRALLARANALLLEAGCKRQGGALLLPDGQPFALEILDDDDVFARVVGPYIQNLKRLGIAATHRIVDATQYQERVKRFDFDIVSLRQVIAATPGDELKNNLGSEAAKTDGSRNLSGIADPVVDALIDKALGAKTREELDTALSALDRVLRALRYWTPHWSKGTHWIAYWDVYARPKIKPPYDRAVLLTWWADAKAAANLQ
jgi:microcin C transport system substrate-binding protein